MVGRICPPPGCDRVKVSENLGATAVAPVAPVDTSLCYVRLSDKYACGSLQEWLPLASLACNCWLNKSMERLFMHSKDVGLFVWNNYPINQKEIFLHST